MVDYFFDTYALIELVKNNPSYVKVADEVVVTTQFNLVELFYRILEDYGEDKAKEIYLKFKACAAEIPDKILFKSMIFRAKNKKRNLSYADCIGYIFAIENNIKFLTGDKEFEKMENVEFLK